MEKIQKLTLARTHSINRIQKRIDEFCVDMNFRRKKVDRDNAEAAFVEAMKYLWEALATCNAAIDEEMNSLMNQVEQNQISTEVSNFFDQDKLNEIIAARKERVFEKKRY